MSSQASATGSPTRPLPPEHARFQAGKSGNPGGKPVGARNRLQGDFMRELAADFEANGKKAIADCREQRLDVYMRVIASLMPKEVEILRPMGDLTDEQLAAAVAAARSLAAAAGVDPGEGASEPAGEQQVEVVSPVPEAG